MRNPSGGAPAEGQGERNGEMVSIDEKPVRRCARHVVEIENRSRECPSMRNPSGGAPTTFAPPESQKKVSIDEKPVRRCAWRTTPLRCSRTSVSIDEKPVRRCAYPRSRNPVNYYYFVSIDEKPVRRCAGATGGLAGQARGVHR